MTLDMQYFALGWFTFPAVQLTPENLPEVREWATSFPFYGPALDGTDDCPITGLTVFTPQGRVKAEFGDWVCQPFGGVFNVRTDAERHKLRPPAQPAGGRAEQ